MGPPRQWIGEVTHRNHGIGQHPRIQSVQAIGPKALAQGLRNKSQGVLSTGRPDVACSMNSKQEGWVSLRQEARSPHRPYRSIRPQ